MDKHKQTASKIFGCNYEDVTEEHRKFAKTVNYFWLYGNNGYHVLAYNIPFIEAAMKLKGEPNDKQTCK